MTENQFCLEGTDDTWKIGLEVGTSPPTTPQKRDIDIEGTLLCVKIPGWNINVNPFT